MRALIGWGLVLALAPARAGAAEVVRLANGNVSVSARGTPLGSMLRQFVAIAPIDTSLIDPKVERSQVHLAVDDVPVPVALAAAFEAAGVAYAVWGSDPANLRVVAFPDGTGPVNNPGVAKAYAPPPQLPEEGYLLPNGIRLPPGISPDDPDVAMLSGPVNVPEIAPQDDPDLAEVLSIDPNVPPPPPPGYDPAHADILGPPPQPEPPKRP